MSLYPTSLTGAHDRMELRMHMFHRVFDIALSKNIWRFHVKPVPKPTKHLEPRIFNVRSDFPAQCPRFYLARYPRFAYTSLTSLVCEENLGACSNTHPNYFTFAGTTRYMGNATSQSLSATHSGWLLHLHNQQASPIISSHGYGLYLLSISRPTLVTHA
jgi:hypothetical protein